MDYGGKTVRQKDKLHEYRGLIRRDIDELEKRLDVIEEKIDKLNNNFQNFLQIYSQ